MIDINSSSRIIGDFIETNAFILEQSTNSKLPKFITKNNKKRKINKLIKICKKLRESSFILNTQELYELFNYIYNTKDTHSFKSIITIKMVDVGIYTSIETAVNTDNFNSIIRINTDNLDTFELIAKEKEIDSIGVNLTLNKLYDDNPKRSKLLYDINKELREILCDYIIEILEIYKDGNKNYDD